MRSIARADRPAADRALPWILGLALALVVWAPVLGRGYVLAHDMVFVPHPDLNARSLGLDGGVPRAVPADFLVALVCTVVPSWVLQQLALVGTVVWATVGAWRMSPARTLPGALAAAVLFAWNPFVAERFAMGHWSLLLGYAVLPWLVVALRDVSLGRGVARVGVLAGVAAFASPTSGVLALGVVAAAVAFAGGPARPRLLALAATVLVNLPWILPGLVAAGDLQGGGAGVDFAARSDTPLGGVASVLTFGGIWNSQVWPSTRSSAVAVVLLLLVVTLAAYGAWCVAREPQQRRLLVSVAVPGLVGLGFVLLSLTGAGHDLMAWLIREVPSAGLLRDTQKWLAWWALLVSLVVGPGVDALVGRAAAAWRVWLGFAVAYVVVAALPTLAWGVGGQLGAVRWPAEYDAARDALDRGGPGAVLVLPFHAVRAWPWNDDRPVLDPWQRMTDRRVVLNDDLELTGTTVPGEDPLARAVRDEGADTPDPARLRELGIRYVVLDRTTAPVTSDVSSLEGGQVLHDGRLLRVWDLGAVARPPGTVAAAPLLLGADLAVGLVWLVLVFRESRTTLTRLLRFGRLRRGEF